MSDTVCQPVETISIGPFVVRYHESFESRFSIKRTPVMPRYDAFWASERRFPDARCGERVLAAHAFRFAPSVKDAAISAWCAHAMFVRARPKEGMDLILGKKQPDLSAMLPLIFSGQCWLGRTNRIALCWRIDEMHRFSLDHARSTLDGTWLDDRCWHLALRPIC